MHDQGEKLQTAKLPNTEQKFSFTISHAILVVLLRKMINAFDLKTNCVKPPNFAKDLWTEWQGDYDQTSL